MLGTVKCCSVSEASQECSRRLPKAQLGSHCKALVQPGVTTWVYRYVPVVVAPFTHLDLAVFFFQQGEVPLVEQSWTGGGITVITTL